MAAPRQVLCTECPTMFPAEGDATTCSNKCRQKRYRRRAKGDQREYAVDTAPVLAAMDTAAKDAVDDLPAVAREVLAEELRPAVREALTGRVLDSIASMVDLLPLAQDALREDLTAVRLVTDFKGEIQYDDDGEPLYEADGDRRQKATALVLKYTVGQPGLSPQPESPEQAPITVIFPSMPAPSQQEGAVDGVAYAELAEGERRCDMCDEAKPADEFVGSSSRCQVCHDAARARIEAAIEVRTQPAS